MIYCDYLLTDTQLADLYKKILVPWERAYGAVTNNWDFQLLAPASLGFDLEISTCELNQVQDRLASIIERKAINFFVFSRRSSKARDLFNHVRNSIAHAGVTRHANDVGSHSLLRFRSMSGSKLAMAGQLEEMRLKALLAAMSEVGSLAHSRSEA